MPELPEVETVRRSLTPRLKGRRIVGGRLRLPRLLEVGAPSALPRLRGLEISALGRKGKYLWLELEDPEGRRRALALIVHLGMTGSLTFRPSGAETTDRFVRLQSGYMKAEGPHGVDAHTHFTLSLEHGELLFRDPRTFGRLLLVPRTGLEATPRIARLGPDALGFPCADFVTRFRTRCGKRMVKSVLLDQGFLAGVGNIYADEACFTAEVLPQARAARLSRVRVGALADAVQEALSRGIENCGTSFRDFVDGEGRKGGNQERLDVYARGGEPCRRCQEPLSKGVVAQRGTVWCRRCQRR